MAQLRPVEERDAKGNTTKINPAITFKQDRQVRVIIGRHDWRLDDNPHYHAPVTAQVQDGKILFFEGVPDNSQTRSAARALKYDATERKTESGLVLCGDVPKYIVEAIRKHPIRVREPRPTVYEVKLATVGDVETTRTEELANAGGADSVTVSAIEPDVNPHLRKGAGKAAPADPVEATL
jgi:hypothetical protein